MEGTRGYISKVLNIIRLILLVSVPAFIFYKLFYAYHLGALWSEYQVHLSTTDLLLMLLAFSLALVKILLEASKWKLIVSRNEEIDFGYALKAVLSGITLSIITPNQIGDFAGRIIHLRVVNKWKGTLLVVVGQTALLIVTVSIGAVAFLRLRTDQGYWQDYATGLNAALFAVIIALVVAFVSMHRLRKVVQRSRFKKYFEVFTQYSGGELVQVLMISLLQYLFTLSQYLLFLYAYGVDVTLTQGLICVAAGLFAQTFIPSFILIDLGLRGVSALWFFKWYTPQHVEVLLMTYSVWIVNFMIPALAGLYFLLRWRNER